MKIINHPELQLLMQSVNRRSPFGERDYWMLQLLATTGLRVAELVALNVGDVSHQGQPRQVLFLPSEHAKGNRSRSIPLNQPARQAIAGLLAFLAMRGFSTQPDAPLLVVRQHRRMSIRLVQQIFQQLREKCALDTPATPHSCRHYFATQLLEATQDLVSVSRLLGHTRVQTTMVYQHSSPERLAQTVRAQEAQW